MTCEISITLTPDEENDDAKINAEIKKALVQQKVETSGQKITPVFIKKSIDARRSQIKLLMRYKVYIGEEPEDDFSPSLNWKHAESKHKVIIVGSGPAGLYAAFRLFEEGIKPIIIERGNPTKLRAKNIKELETEGFLDEDSNFCFGSGGAGTFSDGKLYTRSNKRGDIYKIYKIFVEFGAPPNILTDAHPHIGTDKLPEIIDAMEKKIVELGGEIHFNTLCTDLITEKKDSLKAVGVKTKNLETGKDEEIFADAIILATGHSAEDIYKMLAKIEPSALEAKTFAVGVRVEHPRNIIDDIQFHGQQMPQAAEYRLTAQIEGRGVYSFCMCPGGYVVPCATKKDQIVVNGMSSSGRNSKWSNAAIVTERRTEDIPQSFVDEATANGCPALAGLYWRTWLENLTFKNGNGQFAPAQRLTDFLNETDSKTLPETSYRPGVVSSRLDKWLPKDIKNRLQAAFKEFNHNMKGFICDEALLIASETRTSTPVRILRDKQTLECTKIKSLYPCGEGSGYSGGIGSSAMDGEKVASAVINSLKK
ncbi:NAD(P)/FAD-dependent oxidoreductase [Treponema pectinovorum]|uniref:NAD(P)/FAD-dependent oxidoreductase n=1 Tax=Treponema pectinovorum TaxID=164 RepID=UPI0011C852ED|nr:FAD-binding protein [Treponema pectinovorum]